jgi:hypothetical protein
MLENREISEVSIWGVDPVGRSGKACGHNPGMYAYEKSDIGIVPEKVSNKLGLLSEEMLEERPDDQGEFLKDVCDLYAEAGGSIERT